MTRSRRALAAAVVAAALVLIAYTGLAYMGWTNDHRKELDRLLGPAGSGLLDGASIAAWQPNLDYKPQSYYATRSVDETGFRSLVSDAGLALRPTPQALEGIWQLPPDVALKEWAPSAVPPGSGLQANGMVGQAAVWMRWYRDRAYVVAQPSAP
jgi:hypothetical protein